MKRIVAMAAAATLWAAPASAVEIEVGYPYSHLFDVTYEKIMESFKQEHPEIDVKFRATYEHYEDGTNIILREAISGNLPDITMQGLNRQAILVEKGIAKANLGLNPMQDGQTIRLPMPDLTEERRKDLAKLAGEYGEKAKIAIRNVRRDGMEALKDDEKAKDISEDERKRSEDEVQKLTDKYVAETDVAVEKKVQEILTQ